MKTPKPKRLPSGSWHVQLRLGGESISITEPTEKLCTQKAQLIKAEHLAGKKRNQAEGAGVTLARAIELYCEDRSNGLSPSTIRKYYAVKENHFQELMPLRIDRITDRQWQRAVNAMLGTYAPKTVKVSAGLVKTVVKASCGHFPDISIGKASAQKAREMDKVRFLEPEQIPLFVQSASKSPLAVPMLLALSSLRISEIDGLDWSDVVSGKDGFTVKIRRVRIMDKDGNWVLLDGAKNETSVRNVPVLIPELNKAIKEAGKPSGKIMECCQETLRRSAKRACENAGIPFPGIHGLRHTFASLSAHLGIPEIVSQEIGGWANDKTMKEIYTHVARSDVAASMSKLRAFYESNQEPTADGTADGTADETADENDNGKC